MAATCRSCGRPITWVQTEHGRRMPVDVDPMPDDADAGFALRKLPTGDLLAIAGTRAQLPDDVLHLSHFATCPDADRWRRS